MRRILLICVIVLALVLAACAAELPPAPEPTPDPESEPAPASFTISDLTVDPAEIYAGEQITVSVVVRNVGDLAGDYQIAFVVNRVVVDIADIHLPASESQRVEVTTTVQCASGTYPVYVSGLLGWFTVKELPGSIHLSGLTANSVTFSVAIEDDELSPAQIVYSISGEGYSSMEAWGHQSGSAVLIDDLQQDTVYTLEISEVDSEEVLDSIVFRTFRDMIKGVQLYYLIDAKKPHDHILAVQVFGYMNGLSMLSLENRGYQFHVMNIVENSLQVDAAAYHSDEENRDVTVYANDEQAYFHISYQVDKSVSHTRGLFSMPEYCGFLDQHYLMTTGEVVMLLPPSYLAGQLDPRFEYEVYGYLNHPLHWESLVGFEVEDNLINFLSHLRRKDEGMRAANVYAYNKRVFRKETENIGGTSITVVLQDTIDDKYFADIFSVYSRLCDIWGGGVGDDNYTIMIVDDRERIINAGEWTTGQGFSTSRPILCEKLVHQMYHRWNAWERGIPFPLSADPWVHGFWGEGWNNFYCDKILTELGFMDHDRMRQFYDWYKTIRGTPPDVPVLETRRGIDDQRIVYWKGALLAYLLDQEIRRVSNNEHSLDDVLKYEWERWSVHGESSDYDIVIGFIRDGLGVDTIDSWWQKYIVENQPMYSDDFDFLAP